MALPAPASATAPPPAALVITGTRTEGDVPAPLTKQLDLPTGFSRSIYQMGADEAQNGFDGMDWVAANGITNSVDLPALIADARARAWLDGLGWLQTGAPGTQRRLVPRSGSSLTLFFGANRHVDHAVIKSDDGPLTITLSDWRNVGSLLYPFRQETVDNTGQRTIIAAEQVELRRKLDPHALDRPTSISHTELTSAVSATIPMTLTGSNKSHILVQAAINGTPAQLIFDTGAANYVTSDAAPKFALHINGGLNLGGVGELSTTGGFATVDRIALGPAALRMETIVVGPSPFPKVDGKPEPVDGFTGFEFLAEFITTIDYPRSTITFASRSAPGHASGTRVRFYSDGHSIYVPATIAGHTGLFRLDTGDAGTVTVFREYAAKFDLKSNAPVMSAGGGLGGAVKEQTGAIRSFALGGLEFQQLPASFSQNKSGAFASRSLAGNLGAGILQCYRLTFDYFGRDIWFEPAPTLPTCGRSAKVRFVKS